MVTQSELDDFHQAIRKQQRGVDEFELIEARHPALTKELYTVSGSVTVKAKLSGRERTYLTGHGTAWVTEFYDDLAAGRL
jgi:hypothetical protein